MAGGSSDGAKNAMERLASVYNDATTIGADIVQVLFEPVSMHFISPRRDRNKSGDLSKAFLLLFAHHGFQAIAAPTQDRRPAIAMYDSTVSKRDGEDQPEARSGVNTPTQSLSTSSSSIVDDLANPDLFGKFGAPGGASSTSSTLGLDVGSGSVLVEEPGHSSTDTPNAAPSEKASKSVQQQPTHVKSNKHLMPNTSQSKTDET